MMMLESERLLLRPLVKSDAADVFAYRSDAEVGRYQSWRPLSIADVHSFLDSMIVPEPDRPNTWFQLAICTKAPPMLVGDCGLHFLNEGSGEVEIGITLSRAHQRRGYACEALRLVFDYALGELGKRRIIASVDPRNRPSIRLLERMGMREEALGREAAGGDGQPPQDLRFVILAATWRAGG